MEHCCPEGLSRSPHCLYSCSSSLVLPLLCWPISAAALPLLSASVRPLPFFGFGFSCPTPTPSLGPSPSRYQSRSQSWLPRLSTPKFFSQCRHPPQKRLLRSCQGRPKVYHRSRLKHRRITSTIPFHRGRSISANPQPSRNTARNQSFVKDRRLHFDRPFPDAEARLLILHIPRPDGQRPFDCGTPSTTSRASLLSRSLTRCSSRRMSCPSVRRIRC